MAGSRSSRGLKALSVALVSLASLLVGLLVIEVLVRAFVPVARIPPMFVADSVLIHRLKPGVRERAIQPGSYEYRWTTNAQGLRAREEFAIPKPPGVLRVLMLGDSFTFGLGVDDAQTYAARLEEALGRLCSEREIEVINAGVGGYGTAQQLAFYRTYGRAFDPDLVTIGVFGNDPIDNVVNELYDVGGDSIVLRPAAERPSIWTAKRLVDRIPFYSFLVRESATVNLLRMMILRSRWQDMEADASHRRLATSDSLTTDQWRITERLLAALARDVKRDGANLLTLILPSAKEMEGSLTRNPDLLGFPTRLGVICDGVGLECIDVGAEIADRGLTRRTTPLFIPGDGHFTAIGHELTARVIADPVARHLGCGIPDGSAAHGRMGTGG